MGEFDTGKGLFEAFLRLQLRDQVRHEAAFAEGGSGGQADGGNTGLRKCAGIAPALEEPVAEKGDAIGAGENRPVDALERMLQCPPSPGPG